MSGVVLPYLGHSPNFCDYQKTHATPEPCVRAPGSKRIDSEGQRHTEASFTEAMFAKIPPMAANWPQTKEGCQQSSHWRGSLAVYRVWDRSWDQWRRYGTRLRSVGSQVVI